LLLVEDDPISRRVTAELLAFTGIDVSVAEHGQAACDRLTAPGARPVRLVLMDVQMPELDGLAATGRIRALGTPAARTPIVAVTANAMTGDRERYMAAGMDGYVSKPISLQGLMSVLESLAVVPKSVTDRAVG
jgi:CheY-like chemotaxis protein